MLYPMTMPLCKCGGIGFQVDFMDVELALCHIIFGGGVTGTETKTMIRASFI
jgi:hypothetical protein